MRVAWMHVIDRYAYVAQVNSLKLSLEFLTCEGCKENTQVRGVNSLDGDVYNIR